MSSHAKALALTVSRLPQGHYKVSLAHVPGQSYLNFGLSPTGSPSTLGIAQHKGLTLMEWMPRQWSRLRHAREAT